MNKLEVLVSPDRSREQQLEKEIEELKTLYFEAISALQAFQFLAEGFVGNRGSHAEKKVLAEAMAKTTQSTLNRLKKKSFLTTSAYSRWLSDLRHGCDTEF